MEENKNKRIAKNTLLLYFRMFLIMIVNLFTVRVVLNTLGAIDYGIYNVIGGIVMMFTFISGTMASASQRFFAFELGRKDMVQLKKTFSTTMIIYVLISIIILILAETVGLWFINTQMTIPPERMHAARWVYQFSILSFMMTMFTVPYNATIIAHENMKIYAYVSIVEVILKLLIVYLLLIFSTDKLKLYAILMFAVTTIITFIYRTYCKKKYEECHFTFYWDKTLLSKIISYSGWNIMGTLSVLGKTQALNILLNIFFGAIANAAYGISNQVQTVINSFVQNFLTAVRPQIVKYYAEGDIKELLKLTTTSSKFAFFLLYLLCLPLLFEMEFVFNLWLKNPPEYSVLFTTLLLIETLIVSLSYPLVDIVMATGNVKKYNIVVSSLILLNFPISYILFKSGFQPYYMYIVMASISSIALLARIYIIKKDLIKSFNVGHYFRNVLFPIIKIVIPSCIIIYFIHAQIPSGLTRFIIITISSVFVTLLLIIFFGLNISEKTLLKSYIVKLLKKK